ncbi:MAG: hypothetical protein BA864_07945 [Desulfuromonadales bacterium C00003093]|nr:MAG: hypothetical protein BA864_07945 [Desulfuromonadales bacterium C00003093]
MKIHIKVDFLTIYNLIKSRIQPERAGELSLWETVADLQITVEDIETTSQRDFLSEQGFLFSKPASRTDRKTADGSKNNPRSLTERGLFSAPKI